MFKTLWHHVSVQCVEFRISQGNGVKRALNMYESCRYNMDFLAVYFMLGTICLATHVYRVYEKV